jgi:hypothetical protein
MVKLNESQIDTGWNPVKATPVDKDGHAVGPAKVLSETSGACTLTISLPAGAVGYRLENAGNRI